MLELATLISLVGVIIAVFAPAFLRQVRTSKVSEAPEILGELHKRAAAYFAARVRDESGRLHSRCLPSSAGPTPVEPTREAVDVDFAQAADFGPTWAAIAFQPERPVRYRYTMTTEASTCDLEDARGKTMITFTAEGDLDGDGQRSLFERRATINEAGELVPKDVLFVRDRTE